MLGTFKGFAYNVHHTNPKVQKGISTKHLLSCDNLA